MRTGWSSQTFSGPLNVVPLYGLIWDFSQHGSHGEVGQSLSAAHTSKAIVPVNQTQVLLPFMTEPQNIYLHLCHIL